MATNADEFLIKLNSNLTPAATRDEAALRSLDAQIRATIGNVSNLDAKLAAAEQASKAQAAKVADAAKALERVQAGAAGSADIGAVRAAQAKVAAEQRGLDAAKAREAAALKAVSAEKAALETLQKARPALAKSAEAAKIDADAKKAAAESTKELGASAQAIGGPLGELSGKLSALDGLATLSAGSLIALGASALALAVVVGALAAYAALVKFALAATAAHREIRILGDALSGVTRRPGAEFGAIVDQLARQVPLAKDQIAELAKELALLRLGGRDLQAGLTAVAIVTSALGDAAGRGVKGIVEQSAAIRRFTLGARDLYGEFTLLAGTGLTKTDVLGALAKQLGKSIPEVERMLLLGQIKMKDGLRALEAAAQSRFGKTIAAQMLSFNVQIDKAREALAAMFDGLALEPVLEGLKEVLSVLDQSTVTGKALRFLLNAGLQAFIDAAGAGLPLAKSFLQGMAIAALKLYIALKPTVTEIGKIVGALTGTGNAFEALTAGKIALYGIAAAALVVGASLLLAFSPFIVVGLLIYGVVRFIYAVIAALSELYDAVAGAVGGATDYLSSLDWSALGSALIDGLISGITSGAGKLLASVTSLGTSAIASFKATMGIASPSKVFAGFGVNTVEGFVAGVDANAGEADAAVAGLGAGSPEVAAGGPAVQVAPAGGGGVNVNFYGPVSIGGGDSKEAFAEWLIAKIRAGLTGGTLEET